MKLRRQLVVICATIPLLWSISTHEAAAYFENFESYTNGMGVRDIPNWNAPTIGGTGNGNYTVWQNSEINSTPGGNPSYGSAGYNNSQGVEAKFASSGNVARQQAALDNLTGGDIFDNTEGPGFFSMQVRLTSYGMADGGNTNMSNAGTGTTLGGNSAILYLGTGFQFNDNSGQHTMYFTNAAAFAVYFFAGDNGANSSIFANTKAAENASWQPGFAATLGTQPSWAYRNDSNNTAWARDTWYTVQLSNITLTAAGGQATNATALLTIYNSDTQVKLLDNVLITAQGGNSNAWGSAFTQINQIAFADVRVGAVDDFDNILLVPEPNTALLTFAGLIGVAGMLRKRHDRRHK